MKTTCLQGAGVEWGGVRRVRHTVGVQATAPHWGSKAEDLQVNLRGFHRKAQTPGFSGKSGIEPPPHWLQSDAACAQEGFSDQKMC